MINNQDQTLSDTTEFTPDPNMGRLAQILILVHRDNVTWEEATKKLGYQVDDDLNNQEIMILDDEYEEEEEFDLFLHDDDLADAPDYSMSDFNRFKALMASQMPKPATPPQPTFIIENATEILIQLTTSFMAAWEMASEAMHKAILGDAMQFAPVGGVMGGKLSSNDAETEEEGTFICGFTQSFETTEDGDISEIACKIFAEGNEPELCRAKLQLEVHGGNKRDLRGITVILQVDDEEYEEYSDSLGKVVFEKVKKNQLNQGQISFRVVND